MHLTALQILGPDWLRLVLLMPWRLDSAGGQTPATPPHLAVDSCVLQDDGQDDSWAVVVASYLWTRIGGFDEAFVLPYFPDMVARISLAGKVGYVADQDTAGICLPLADGLDTQWAKQLSCLPPAYQDQTEATILARIRNLSETRIGQGQVIRDPPRQAPMWAPAVRAKPVLLELLVTPMPTTDEEAEQVDWGAEEDLEQIALTTFKARAADFLAAATAWSPAEPAAAAALPPALGTLFLWHACLCSVQILAHMYGFGLSFMACMHMQRSLASCSMASHTHICWHTCTHICHIHYLMFSGQDICACTCACTCKLAIVSWFKISS